MAKEATKSALIPPIAPINSIHAMDRIDYTPTAPFLVTVLRMTAGRMRPSFEDISLTEITFATEQELRRGIAQFYEEHQQDDYGTYVFMEDEEEVQRELKKDGRVTSHILPTDIPTNTTHPQWCMIFRAIIATPSVISIKRAIEYLWEFQLQFDLTHVDRWISITEHRPDQIWRLSNPRCNSGLGGYRFANKC